MRYYNTGLKILGDHILFKFKMIESSLKYKSISSLYDSNLKTIEPLSSTIQ